MRGAAERLADVDERRQHEEPLRPGVSLELDVETLAQRAAPAVTGDHVVEVVAFAPRAALDVEPDATLVLREIEHARAETDLCVRHARQAAQPELGELVLLGLDDVGIGRLVLEHVMVEARDERVAVPQFEIPRHQPERHEFVEQLQLREHLQGGRMRGGGPRCVIDGLFRFEQRHLHAPAGAGDRRNDADWTGADDCDARAQFPASHKNKGGPTGPPS